MTRCSSNSRVGLSLSAAAIVALFASCLTRTTDLGQLPDGSMDPPDGSMDPTSDGGMDCTELVSSWKAAVLTMDRSCTTVDDCMAPGDCDQNCNCKVALGNGSSDFVSSRSAYTGSTAAAVEQEFWESCYSTAPQVCDCGPAVLECVNAQCRISGRQCCGCPLPSDAGLGDGGARSCLTASDCAAGEHCDVALDKCGTGFEAVLVSSKCTKPACGSACLGEACASSEDCAGGQVCGMTSMGTPSCSSPCCQDWGRCTMVPSCREGCTAIWPPHETCFVCVCPSCEPPDETSAKRLFEQAYALSSADLACTGDEDCCVVLDYCNNAALIVHQNDQATVRDNLDQANKLAQGPTSDSPCNACIPPPVVARCESGKCVGRVLHCSLGCLGDAGVPDADTTGWCREHTGQDGMPFVSDHCGNEIPLPAGLTDDPTCSSGGGSGGSYTFGCSPY